MLHITAMKGNSVVVIKADNEARHELASCYRDPEKGPGYAEMLVCEALREQWHPVQPEWVAASPETPVFAERVVFDKHTTFEDHPRIAGDICWFPDYKISDPWRKLASTGRVEFVKAKL